MNPLHTEEEIAAFMKATSDPAFQASQQPITVAEANRIRQSFTGLNQQLNMLLQKVSEQRQTIHRLTSRVEDLETEAKQLKEHYKTFNDFRAEMKACLQLVGDRLTEMQDERT